jgi:DNA-binding CsgD family transcriptional regulator
MIEREAENSTPLSERQIEILRLAAKGATNQQIAVQLDIAENTVKAHLRNIYGKIGVSSRTEASIYAARAGLLDVETPAEPEEKTSAAPDPSTAPVVVASTPPAPPTESIPLAPTHRRKWLWGGGGVLLGLVLIGLIVALMQFSDSLFPFVHSPIPSRASPLEPAATLPPDESDLWQTNTAMNMRRENFGLSSYNGKIYVIGGETTEGVSRLVERYNPQQDSWAEVAALPVAVADIQAVEIGGDIYVAGGRLDSGAISDQFLLYDPARDQWEELPPLPQPRSRYAAVSVEGKYYLFGGWDGHTYCSQVWTFVPDTKSWDNRSLTPMLAPRADMSATPAGNSIHLIGGRNAEGPVQLHHAYDPNLDQTGSNPWRVLPPLPQLVEGRMTAVAVIDSIYTFNSTTGKLKIYDTGRESWRSFDNTLPAGSKSLDAIMVNTKIFILGTTAEGMPYHLSYQAIYRTQLPIISR